MVLSSYVHEQTAIEVGQFNKIRHTFSGGSSWEQSKNLAAQTSPSYENDDDFMSSNATGVAVHSAGFLAFT